MRTTFTLGLALATLLATTTLPVGRADPVEVLACPNPGDQGYLTSVPYLVWVDGTGWGPGGYYVYGTYYYANLHKYNYCVAGLVQVGAASIGGYWSYSWGWCVTCGIVIDGPPDVHGRSLLP